MSHLTLKKVHNNKLTEKQEHLFVATTLHQLKTFLFWPLAKESNDFKLKIIESLLIASDIPIVNKPDSSLHLELFSCTLQVLVFYQKPNLWAFNIILGVTMKAVALENFS